MVERKPLVLVDGLLRSLPDGDTIAGASGGGGGGGGGSSESVIITMIAGEDLEAGDIVAPTSDGLYRGYAQFPIGFVQEATLSGNIASVILSGVVQIPNQRWGYGGVPEGSEGSPVYIDYDNNDKYTLTINISWTIYQQVGVLISSGTGNCSLVVQISPPLPS